MTTFHRIWKRCAIAMWIAMMTVFTTLGLKYGDIWRDVLSIESLFTLQLAIVWLWLDYRGRQ